MQSLITLTTDFGDRDWYAGVMKGVILGIAPDARIVDLTHSIPPGDLRAGALAIAAACPHFPRRTIHVVVVDPGVGTARRAVVVRTKRCWLVGPDNGVLSLVTRREGMLQAHALTNPEYWLTPLSRTFHGRDLFAPVAAHLWRGVPAYQLGPPVSELDQLDWPEPRVGPESARGEVLYIDRFGNAITSLSTAILKPTIAKGAQVRLGKNRLIPVMEAYQTVGGGEPLALMGSAGLLEIAVNGGSAARSLALKVGTPVILEWQGKRAEKTRAGKRRESPTA